MECHRTKIAAREWSETMTNGQITPDELRNVARQVGLNLSDDELQRLLPGVNRARKQAAELRAVVSLETETAVSFKPPMAQQK
jgi:Ca2+-binding EF-hand superfamily protein